MKINWNNNLILEKKLRKTIEKRETTLKLFSLEIHKRKYLLSSRTEFRFSIQIASTGPSNVIQTESPGDLMIVNEGRVIYFQTARKISSLLYNSHCIWQVSTFLSFEGSPPESGEYAICPVISSYVQYTEHLGCCDGFRIHPHLPAWCVCDTDGRACLTNIKCVQITNFKLRIIWLPIPSLSQDHRFLQSQECINGGLYLWGTPHSPIASIRALIALVLPAPVGPNIIIPWRTRCVSNNWRRRNCNNQNT